MQNYTEISGQAVVKDSRTLINQNFETIQSNNSGSGFPTNYLFAGMKCYRADTKHTYTLVDVDKQTWVDDASADTAKIADTAKVADKCTGNADTATKAIQDKNGADIAATYFQKSGGTMSGNLTVPTIYSNSWFRSYGDTGWYSETHKGGWYMTDDTWVRSYNGKGVYTAGKMQADGGFYGVLHGTADNATNANTVVGTYGQNGGRFAPNKFGKNRVGFLMSNDLGGNYKNWLVMDNYEGTDAGGATALGLDRSANRAYIMRSNADRQSWVENAELITSANIGSQSVTHASKADNSTHAGTADNAGQLGGSTLAQVLAQINAGNTGGIIAASFGANGYVKWSNGFILQWGVVAATSTVAVNSYPIAFPNGCFEILGSYGGQQNDGYSAVTGLTARPYNNSQFLTLIYASSAHEYIRWIAVGN